MATESRFTLTEQQDRERYEAPIDRARHQIAKRVELSNGLARVR